MPNFINCKCEVKNIYFMVNLTPHTKLHNDQRRDERVCLMATALLLGAECGATDEDLVVQNIAHLQIVQI